MVSETTRRDVWQGLLDIVRYHLYYGALASKYRTRHFWVRLSLALSAILTAAPLLPSVPDVISSIGGVAIIVLVVVDLLLDYGKTAATLSVIVTQLNELEIRHRQLWSKTNSELVSDEEARSQLDEILNGALNLVRGSGLKFDEGLNERCQKRTYEMEQVRYDAAG